ncbi:redoxin domain-containing protein [Bacillus aerolatus]|uniref:Redoxin domain-containing protein n=1 Tax=Bacillus aerolatus TaxID=2653354 RepID=A0A6I1FSK6_9BACI|nr:TlpA disulfide reductase family protein [Bacillus aerolatus]KAB7705256.1 redoxin domain-containing protein [Bacillus aerolatus]
MNWKVVLAVVIVAFMGVFLYKEYIEETPDSKAETAGSESNAESNSSSEGENQSTDGKYGLLVGQQPPNIQLTTLDNKPFNLTDYKGKTVILNFWATWCPPCKAEMPDMQKFYEKHKNEGVEVVAVNLTSAEKSKDHIQKFIDEYQISFTVPLDPTGATSQQYEVYSIPSSFIIDKEGVIRQHVIGPMSYDWMINEVKKLQ